MATRVVVVRSVFPMKGLGGWGGGLPCKSDEGARRIFWRQPLKGTKILFCGRGPKLILPLRGTKIKRNLTCL